MNKKSSLNHTASSGETIRTWLPLILLTGLVLLLFGRTLGFGFTNWDDGIYIAENPVLRSVSWHNIRRIFTPGGVPRELIFIPLTYLSMLLEMRLFGGDPGAMHATQVLLHLANSLLVFALLRRLHLNIVPALLGALVFAVHPIQVESVAWLMGRKDLLSAMFALLCLHAFLYFRRTDQPLWYVLSLVTAAAAMLSKPTLIILALLLLLLCSRHERTQKHPLWLQCLPFVVLAGLVFFLNRQMPVETDFAAPPFRQRLPAVLWLGWHWFSKILPLSRPTPIYAWPVHMPWLGILPAALLIAGIVVGWKRRIHWLWFGPTLFFISLAPALMVVIEGRDFVTADRYGYFAMLGVCLFLGGAVQALNARQRRRGMFVMAAWIGVLCLVSFRSVGVWADSEAVWNRVLDEYPDCVLALTNRANTLAEQGRRDAAARDFQRALKLAPDSYPLLLNLATFYAANSEFAKAIPHLETAISSRPDPWRAHYQLGLIHAAQDQPEAALRELQLAARLRQSTDILFALAQVLEQCGLRKEAWEVYRQVLLQSPTHLIANYNLANIYRQSGQLDAAAHHYRQALTVHPGHVESRINLALVLIERDQLTAAAMELETAFAEESAYRADILYHLARIHLAADRPDLSRSALERALAINPDHTDANLFLKRLDDMDSGRID